LQAVNSGGVFSSVLALRGFFADKPSTMVAAHQVSTKSLLDEWIACYTADFEVKMESRK
jgi:hypothetical protein